MSCLLVCALAMNFALTEALRLNAPAQKCLGFDRDSKFPIKGVNDLLKGKHGQDSKEALFSKVMAKLGGVVSVVGQRQNLSCSKPMTRDIHFYTIGDSTMEETAFQLRNEFRALAKPSTQKKFASGQSMNDLFQSDSQEDVSLLSTNEFEMKGGYRVIQFGVRWKGDSEEDVILKMADRISRWSSYGNTGSKNPLLVLWMGTSAHHISQAYSEKTDGKPMNPWVADREQMVRTHLLKVKEMFPNATLIWDSPIYLDAKISAASPPKPDIAWMTAFNANRISKELLMADDKVCKELNVPMSQRWKLGRAYRGLQCDGVHHHGAYGSPGFLPFHTLVFQSALMNLCQDDSFNLCKDLDHDYDSEADP